MANRPKKKPSRINGFGNTFTELSIRRLANSLGLADEWLAQFVIHLPDGSVYIAPRARWHILAKAVLEQFCVRFAPGSAVFYISDKESRFVHLESAKLAKLGVVLDKTGRLPDLIVHSTAKNWLLLVELVVSASPEEGNRRKELRELFKGCKAGLVFVTAFQGREEMRAFLLQISWQTEVWVADEPDHLIHFDGNRLLGPYPDAVSRL